MVFEEAKVLNLLDKDFKITIWNMFKELRKAMFKELKKV